MNTTTQENKFFLKISRKIKLIFLLFFHLVKHFYSSRTTVNRAKYNTFLELVTRNTRNCGCGSGRSGKPQHGVLSDPIQSDPR